MLNKINMAQQKVAFCRYKGDGAGGIDGNEKGDSVDATMGDVRAMAKEVKRELREEMVQMKSDLQKDVFESKSCSDSGAGNPLLRPNCGNGWSQD